MTDNEGRIVTIPCYSLLLAYLIGKVKLSNEELTIILKDVDSYFVEKIQEELN